MGTLDSFPNRAYHAGALMVVGIRPGDTVALELYCQLLRAFGGRLAIGSRAEDGPAGVMNTIRTLQSRRPVALSPDGPKGPRHQLKPGIAFVALAAKAFVVPIGVYAKSKVVLRNSWDKAWIPLPFSSVLLVVSDPIDPEAFEGQGKDALEALRRAIQSRLEEVEFKAKAFCHDGRKQGRTFQGGSRGYENLDPSLLGRAIYLLGLWFLWLMRLGMLPAWLREALKLLKWTDRALGSRRAGTKSSARPFEPKREVLAKIGRAHV